MKQLLPILAFLMASCFAVHAQIIKTVPSCLDSTRMDTIVISELQDADDAENAIQYAAGPNFDVPSDIPSIAFVALIICCGLPFFIVTIILWFRYKNKQAKYKLAAEALAAGKNIPTELFNETEDPKNAIMAKGIKNIFLGIGLAVFFWVATYEEGLAAIGFLILCMGLGQILIAYTTAPRKKKENDFLASGRTEEDENRPSRTGNDEKGSDEKDEENPASTNTTDTITHNTK